MALHQMIEAGRAEPPVLVPIDEIFAGMNSRDRRIATVRRLLRVFYELLLADLCAVDVAL